LLDHEGHLHRLHRSLRELQIAPPMSDRALNRVIGEVIRRNRVRDGLVYLQITRGAARRDHAFPSPNLTPTLVIYARPSDLSASARRQREGVAVATSPDLRWRRCDIKSVSLLPNVLARQAAKELGAAEAWLVDDHGFITEGAASTAWIIDREGRLRTRSLEANILPGVTREVLLEICAQRQITISTEPFTTAHVHEAREAFMTSAGVGIVPVVRLDQVMIADGQAGPITRLLQSAYAESSKPAPPVAARRKGDV
jgi:D-alanine transaminase